MRRPGIHIELLVLVVVVQLPIESTEEARIGLFACDRMQFGGLAESFPNPS